MINLSHRRHLIASHLTSNGGGLVPESLLLYHFVIFNSNYGLQILNEWRVKHVLFKRASLVKPQTRTHTHTVCVDGWMCVINTFQ